MEAQDDDTADQSQPAVNGSLASSCFWMRPRCCEAYAERSILWISDATGEERKVNNRQSEREEKYGRKEEASERSLLGWIQEAQGKWSRVIAMG